MRQMLAIALALAVHGTVSVALLSAQEAKPAADEVKPAAAQPAEAAANAPADRMGQWIRLPAPITDAVDAQVRRSVDAVMRGAKQRGQWPVFILELGQGPTQFGQALDLARYLSSPALNGATTVAYLPETISGHAVLVAIACDEIIMHPDAEIGNAGEYERVIEPSVRSAYVEIANRRKTVPSDLALGMLDPALEILIVETDVSREFVRAERLEELKKEKSVQSTEVLIRAGEPGVFTGREARELGFVSYLAVDRLAAVQALGLSRRALEEPTAFGDEWRTMLVELKGPLNATLAQRAQKSIQEQIREHDVNFILVRIDSPGGAPIDSMNLANFLGQLDASERRTVAYIPNEALGDAAFIALACDHVIMHPGARLGDAGAADVSNRDIPQLTESLTALAVKKYRSPALLAAMVDPQAEVFRYTRQTDGLVDYFTSEGVRRLADADKWQQGPAISRAGGVLQVDGRKAEELGLARNTVDNFTQLKALYALENDPRLVEPGWADILIDALNSPGVAWLLLVVGGAALWAELQAPGIGVGGVVAAVCFLLYFWSSYLGGTAGWLEVLLFGAGLIFLLVEIFVLPGFGLFGLCGGLLLLSSLILASQTFVIPHNQYQMKQLTTTLTVLVTAGFGSMLAIAMLHRLLPHAPVLGRVLLNPPDDDEQFERAQRESLAHWEHLVGVQGTASTPLVPGGKGGFGDELVDVVSIDGAFVERGTPITVLEVHGSRVLVQADEASI